MKSKYKPVGKLQSQNNQTWFHYDPAVNASLIHHILTKDISTDVLSNEEENSTGAQQASGQVAGLAGATAVPRGRLQPVEGSSEALSPSLLLWPLQLFICEPSFLSCSLQSYYY